MRRHKKSSHKNYIKFFFIKIWSASPKKFYIAPLHHHCTVFFLYFAHSHFLFFIYFPIFFSYFFTTTHAHHQWRRKKKKKNNVYILFRSIVTIIILIFHPISRNIKKLDELMGWEISSQFLMLRWPNFAVWEKKEKRKKLRDILKMNWVNADFIFGKSILFSWDLLVNHVWIHVRDSK